MECKIFDWNEHISGDYSQKPDIWKYTHLRLFHGCRPINVQSYFDNGIQVMPFAKLETQFREVFADFGSESLDKAITQYRNQYCSNDRRVDTVLDRRFLIRHASHYFRLGSETLQALATYLPLADGMAAGERLRNVGIPTVFVIKAPVPEIDDETLHKLDETLNSLATNGTDDTLYDEDLVDFTVSFSEGVPRDWVVSHEIVCSAT